MTTSWLQAVVSPGSTRPRRRSVVAINGASAGVGRAAAAAFGQRGWSVALLARGRKGLEDTKREVEQAGGRAPIPTPSNQKGPLRNFPLNEESAMRAENTVRDRNPQSTAK